MTDAAIHRVSADAGGLSVRLLRASGSPRPQGARDDNGGWVCDEKKNSLSLLFPLHPSPFALPSLAFLETNTEAYAIGAVTRGEVVALS